MKSVKVFPEKRKYVYQSGVVFGATLINLAATMAFAWASPGLPKLLEPGGPFLITVNQGTAIVSAMKVALVVVPIPAAWMMDRFGRTRTLLIGAVPLLCGWIMLALAETFELIIAFYFFAGFAMAFSDVVLPMYIAEISSAHIRGYLGVLFTVMGKTGLLLMYAIGPFLSIRLMAWLSTIPVILFIAIFFWLPESPYHLIAQEQLSLAERNLQKLRCSHEVKEELSQMVLSVEESQENKGTFRELFFHPRNRRSIIIVLGLSALLQLSGSQIVLQYAQTIFATLDSGLASEYNSIIFGVVQLFAAILACFLVDTMGRRPLLLTSIISSGSCTLVIGIYYILERHIDVSGIGWLPLTAIMLFMVTYSTGMLPVAYIITSESFPKHLKGVAGATLIITANLIGIVLVYAYQYGLDNWGSDYVFIAFSLVTFAFVPFVWFLIPETKRKTLETILSELPNK